MISVDDQNGFTHEVAKVSDIPALVEKENIDLAHSKVRMRVQIPGSDFEPLVEAIEASGGKVI